LKILLRISQIIDLINEEIGKLTYWLILVMVGVGAWNVIGRYLGRWIGQSLTSNSLIELQWYLFAIIFFLGAAYTLKHNSHVRVDLFYKDLKAKPKAIINLIGIILFLIPFCVMVIYYSWGYVLNSWDSQEISPDDGGLPRYPIKTMIIISPILLIIQGVSEAIKNMNFLINQNNQ
jgi:TRAP-type mannitol/chloroaromatic compound transport system permease small subunit